METIGFALANKLIDLDNERADTGSTAVASAGDGAAHVDMIGRHHGHRVDVPMSVRVSMSFERLMGYSQLEIREWFSREGETALFQVIRTEGWARFMELDFDAKWEGKCEYSLYVMCSTKWTTRVPCLLHCHNSFGNEGNLSKRVLSFIRLPV